MTRLILCTLVVIAIVAVAWYLMRLRQSEQSTGTAPGAHERIQQPVPALEASAKEPSLDVTSHGIKDLRGYLERALSRPTRRSRTGKRYLIGKSGDNYMIVAHLSKGTWRYVCTPLVLWGAKRPESECARPDNTSTGDLDPLSEIYIDELLRDLMTSYPV